MKKGKRFLAILLVILIICGGVIGVSAAVRKTTSGGKVMVISAEELNYGYGYWDSESMEGFVTSDRTQNVTLNTSQTVEEVKVTEGQEVKKGDILLVYDMKQTEINLEKAELKLEQLKQSLKNAEEGLKKLKNMSPSSGGIADEADEPDDEEEEDEKEKKPVKQPKATLSLTGSSKPYYDNSSEVPAPGTEENPYRFLVKAGATVNADFINMIKKLQGQNQSCYFVLELRENDVWEGRLIRSWKQDASDVVSPDKDWLGIVDPDNEKPILPTKTFAEVEEMEKQIEENKKKIEALENELKELKEKQLTPTPTAAPTTQPEETAVPTEAPEDEKKDGAGTGTDAEAAAKISELEGTIAELTAENEALKQQIETLQASAAVESGDPETNSSSGSSSAEATALRAAVQVMQTAVYQKITPVSGSGVTTAGFTAGNSGVVSTLTALEAEEDDSEEADESDDSDDSDDESDTEADTDASTGSLADIDEDTEYTREELTDAQKQQQETIADLKLDIREAEIKVKNAKKALEDGSVKALLDGVVTKVADPATYERDGTPFIRVSGSKGIAIKGGLPEKLLSTIREGDQISVASWTSGVQYTATITEISPYPDSSGMFDSGAAYNNSYYPFTAIIDDEDAQIEDNDWVQISIDANTLAQDDGFYLMRAFVLEEGTSAYVYKRGEDGLLHRQDVVLGKLSGDSYEIKDGLTSEDWVAFPYGKTVKEGAQTREGTMEELYN